MGTAFDTVKGGESTEPTELELDAVAASFSAGDGMGCTSWCARSFEFVCSSTGVGRMVLRWGLDLGTRVGARLA